MNEIDFYDMNRNAKHAVAAWTKENGFPGPAYPIAPIVAGLMQKFKLSLVCREIDEIVDLIDLLNDRIRLAIGEGNLVAVVMLRERLGEEKEALKEHERLLDREGPLGKRDENMERMIANARDYSFEDLISSYGCQVKFHRTRCPIHEGKNPSSFEIKNNHGRCHSCGWHGDTIEFLRKMEGCSFLEAVRRLQ